MSLYRRVVVPALVDLLMSGDRFSRLRAKLLAPVSGEVLEIGFGTGLNLPFYTRAVGRVTAVDRNPGMSKRGASRIAQSGVDVRHVVADGAALSFDDDTFDAVVTTWTLCSIRQVESALAEIRRVLRGSGTYVFVEHGASPDPGVRKWQDRLTPIERRIADGCHLNREIESLVRTAGFGNVAIDRFYMDGLPRVAGYTYFGSAAAARGPDTRPPDAMMR